MKITKLPYVELKYGFLKPNFSFIISEGEKSLEVLGIL